MDDEDMDEDTSALNNLTTSGKVRDILFNYYQIGLAQQAQTIENLFSDDMPDGVEPQEYVGAITAILSDSETIGYFKRNIDAVSNDTIVDIIFEGRSLDTTKKAFSLAKTYSAEGKLEPYMSNIKNAIAFRRPEPNQVSSMVGYLGSEAANEVLKLYSGNVQIGVHGCLAHSSLYGEESAHKTAQALQDPSVLAAISLYERSDKPDNEKNLAIGVMIQSAYHFGKEPAQKIAAFMAENIPKAVPTSLVSLDFQSEQGTLVNLQQFYQ